MFEPNDDHLELLFAYGLGRGTGGPWQERLGPALQSPADMLADQLIWAVEAGRAESGRRAAERTGSTRTALAAAIRRMRAGLLTSGPCGPAVRKSQRCWQEAGARGLDQPLDPVRRADRRGAGGVGPDASGTATRIYWSAPGRAGRRRSRRRSSFVAPMRSGCWWRPASTSTAPAALLRCTRPRTPATWRWPELLVELGADLTREDPSHHSTPLGWAEHAHADEVADVPPGISTRLTSTRKQASDDDRRRRGARDLVRLARVRGHRPPVDPSETSTGTPFRSRRRVRDRRARSGRGRSRSGRRPSSGTGLGGAIRPLAAGSMPRS